MLSRGGKLRENLLPQPHKSSRTLTVGSITTRDRSTERPGSRLLIALPAGDQELHHLAITTKIVSPLPLTGVLTPTTSDQPTISVVNSTSLRLLQISRPIVSHILSTTVASFTLMIVSWIISGVVGFGLGVIAGAKEGTLTDRAIKTYCYILQSTPTFWIGLVLLMVFSVYLGWFPIGLSVPIGQLSDTVTFWQWLYRLILPAITLSIVGIASLTMYTRDKLISVKNSDYFLFAQARGESFWGMIKNHGIRNILLPAISIQFLSFNELFGGTILVEQVFAYPGIGQATVAAGLRSDVPLLLGIVIISAIFVFVGNLIADIIYQYVDPRLRSEDDE